MVIYIKTRAALFPFLCVFFAGESCGEDICTHSGLFTALPITTSWEFRENCAKFYLDDGAKFEKEILKGVARNSGLGLKTTHFDL